MSPALLVAVALLIPAAATDTFEVQAELQGLYDEISQATLQFATQSEVDQFHEVLYTPDWAFTDAAGHTRTWADVREEAFRALSAPRVDSMTQPIRSLSVDSNGATVVVNLVTVRTLVDSEGRYGHAGDSHTLTDTTSFRDRWIKGSGSWKLKSRQQIGGPTESVDKPQ
jgi:ketosteroid isomerase-like protein